MPTLELIISRLCTQHWRSANGGFKRRRGPHLSVISDANGDLMLVKDDIYGEVHDRASWGRAAA